MHRFGLFLAAAVGAAVTVVAPAAPAHAAGTLAMVGDWEMNEAAGTPAGPAALVDSSGYGFHGSVNVNVKDAQGNPDPAAPPRILPGDSDATGAAGTAYRWPGVARDPATGLTLPDDNRLALVPDNPAIDPLSRDYALELRFNTGAPSPNLVQKGQSGPNSPLFKVEVHDRHASCTVGGFYGTVFAKRAVGIPATVANITPNEWHTVRCERTYNATKNTEDIAITVDGVYAKASFPAPAGTTTVIGNIDSPYPLSIGGKSSCNPTDGIGCDYFSGKMDYVRLFTSDPPPVTPPTVTPPPVTPANAAPTAAFSASCVPSSCTLDGTGSSDPDGTVSSWAWTFGDGTVGTGATASHGFATGGSYQVTLTVTDNSGATGSTTKLVAVPAQPTAPIAFRAGSSVTATGTELKAPVPTGVQAGDVLLLRVAAVGTANNPTAPAGWTELARQVFASSTATSVLWQHVATSQDLPGSTISVVLATSVKATAQVLAYSGTSTSAPVSAVASAADTVLTTTHTTPAADVVTAGSLVVSFWTDKSSATTAWTPDAALLTRASTYGTGSGYVSAVAADEGGVRAAGPAPTRTATTNASSRAAMTTVVLAPAGP